MKQIRKRLTYANLMSSIAVFLVLGGATAIAAKVSSKQLKANSVTTGKIKKNAVTTAKIKNDAVTGAKVNEATLAAVPTATTATNLAGQTSFSFRLGFGGTQTIATNGAVSLIAVCDQSGGNDRARILAATTANGAVLEGQDDLTGEEGKFLNVATVPDDREFGENSVTSGKTNVANETDEGFVLGPEGKMLTANSDGFALGLNYVSAGCFFGGVVNAIG